MKVDHVLDILGTKEELLPQRNCKGFINTCIKAIAYIPIIIIPMYVATQYKNIYLTEYTFSESPLKYLGILYFIYMILSLLCAMFFYFGATMLTHVKGKHCLKEVMVESAFFYKNRSSRYQIYLVGILTIIMTAFFVMYFISNSIFLSY